MPDWCRYVAESTKHVQQKLRSIRPLTGANTCRFQPSHEGMWLWPMRANARMQILSRHDQAWDHPMMNIQFRRHDVLKS